MYIGHTCMAMLKSIEIRDRMYTVHIGIKVYGNICFK